MIWNFVFFLNSPSPKSNSFHNNIKLIDSRSASALNLRFAQWSDVENSSCRRDSGYDFYNHVYVRSEKSERRKQFWNELCSFLPLKKEGNRRTAHPRTRVERRIWHISMLVISRSRRTISSRACVGVCFWDLHSKKLNSSSMFVFDPCSSLCYVFTLFQSGNDSTHMGRWRERYLK